MNKTIISILLFFSAISLSAQEIDTTSSEPASTHSPWLAVGFSAIVPGAGQIYNQSYWKAPLLWGVAGYYIYLYSYNDDKYSQFSEKYRASLSKTDLDAREFYRDQRDLFAIYLGITYMLNLVDAYVDGHLFSFNVEEDFFKQGSQLRLKLQIPLF